MALHKTQQTGKSISQPELKIQKSKSLDLNYMKVHHSWQAFIKYCQSIGYGEIEKLKIQDGLPIMAEEVKKKVKFL